MPSIAATLHPSAYTHRQCVALIQAVYPGGCGFDYKRASVMQLQAFLADVQARYPDAYNAACAAFAAPVVHAPAPVAPAPVAPAPVAPAPVAPAPVEPAPVAPAPVEPAPVEPAPVEPAPIMHTPSAAVPIARPAGMPYTLSAAQAFPSVKWPQGFNADACRLRHYASPSAPELDADYLWNADALRLACIANAEGSISAPVWLFGEPGTGKTDFVQNFAAALGRPFHRIQCDRNLERVEFVGGDGLRHGATTFVPGALLRAAAEPGAIVLLDEPTYLTQGNVAVLNGILEMRAPRQYRNVSGDVCEFADGLSFFAADNTNGTGDPSGHFIGAQPMNAATLQRFAYFIRLDYLTRTQEARVLRKRTGATKEHCSAIAAVMSACREKAQSGHLPCAPSMRGAVAFLRAVMHGVPPSDAFEAAVTARSAPESQEELRALFVAHWPAAMSPAQLNTPGAFGTIETADDEEA